MRATNVTGAFLAVLLAGACGSDAPAVGDTGVDQGGPPLEGGTIAKDGPAVDGGAADQAVVQDGSGGAGGQLEGAWYSHRLPADGGMPLHERWRFEGQSYALVRDEPRSYCAEVGSFRVMGARVRFQPDHVEGFGPCRERLPFEAGITWTADGFSLEIDGVSTRYARIRDVRKLFVTTETHNGNLAGDQVLSGATVIEKADFICNRSVARPDRGRYRAVLVDGTNRKAVPPTDWVLQPRTTYFAPDGSLNVLTTDAEAMVVNGHGRVALVDGWLSSYWTGFVLGGGGTCNGWSSDDEKLRGTTGGLNPGAGNSMSCDSLDVPFLCVGEGHTLRELAGPSSGGAIPGLEGFWYTTEELRLPDGSAASDFKRVRFTGDDYALVSDSPGNYCVETGKVDAIAGGVRFLPERIEGFRTCRIGEVRTATLQVSDNQLTFGWPSGPPSIYKRIPSVPKVFATFERHNGDFAGDHSLPGATAFEKADGICNRSIARPDAQVYKALLVDGVKRSITPPIDWVLKPSTAYHYADGSKVMFQTDSEARQVTAGGVGSFLRGGDDGGYYWIGIDFPAVTSMHSCNGWTSANPELRGQVAWWNGYFASNFVAGCGGRERLICVSQ